MYKRLINVLISCSLLWLSFVAIWQLFSGYDFYYSFWYQQLSIQEHVQEYAPKNRQGRKNFAATSPQQHQQIFAAFITSINNSGKGLADIRYQLDSNSYAVLTEAERIHLQDVANLIDVMAVISVAILFILLILLAIVWKQKIAFAQTKQHLLYGLGIVLFVSVAILLMGAKNVFYWLHINIFPADHQWFFFYEDSLMSMLMKAPYLFAPIAISWLLCAILLWLLLIVILNKGLKWFRYNENNNSN